jgi:hypothetical protein
MKIIREGEPHEPAEAWQSRLWRCSACDTVALFERHDTASHNRMLVFYDGDRFRAEYVWSFCPTCGYNRSWHEHTADDETVDAAREAGP